MTQSAPQTPPAHPRFVVVGHVNRGKSSIVSTLAADESVRISEEVGTTRECRSFPMRIAGRVLYELIDTPGFERPRQMLQWLREHETTTAEHRQTVEQFVREHRHDERFDKECRLLEPILEGAAILYVVDGSVPFTEKHEFEMEILRWTGRPRMALINMIHAENYVDQWRPVLDSYFNLVHEFNAHGATFADRVRLIRALREIHKPWEAALNEAIDALLTERRQNQRDAAAEIASMLVSMLTLVEEKQLSAEADVEPHKAPLAERYFAELRRIEERGHRAVSDVYRRAQFHVRQARLEAGQEDLFSEGVWLRFGLSRARLAAGGAVSGAATGGAVDAATGGASFLMGAIIGGIVGAGAGLFGAARLPGAKISRLPLGGKLLRIGPMRNRNFPWIVLDRALEHHRIIAGIPHARRGEIELPAPSESTVATLPEATRQPIQKIFTRLLARPDPAVREEIQFELAHYIEPLLAEQERVEA